MKKLFTHLRRSGHHDSHPVSSSSATIASKIATPATAPEARTLTAAPETPMPAGEWSQSFDYEPLVSLKAIRLVQLQPGTGAIACTLVNTTLSDALYNALSYTWGDPYPRRTEENGENWEPFLKPAIFCNGQLVTVTRNLHEALIQLRLLKLFEPIWIDAICINQLDVDEKSVQMEVMGTIYANAQQVFVWLGKDDQSTEESSASISSLGAILQGQNAHSSSDSNSFDPGDSGQGGLSESALLTVLQSHAVARLFSRSWFTRGWVVQEIALAKRARVFCGAFEFDLINLFACAVMLGKTVWVHCGPVFSSEEAARGLPALTLMFALSVECKSGGPESDKVNPSLAKSHGALNARQRAYAYLERLIGLTQIFQFTEKRDKVFAPLALAKFLIPPNAEIKDWMSPNLRSSVEQVFTDVCHLILRNVPSLSLLSLVGEKSDSLELPSWVPDFTAPKLATLMGDYDATKDLPQHQWEEPIDLLSANELCGKKDSERLLNNLLPVTAIFFDSIKVTSVEASVGLPTIDQCSSWFNIVRQLPKVYALTKQNRVELLWRTLIADQDYTDDGTMPEHIREVFPRFINSEFERAFSDFTENKRELVEESGEDRDRSILPISNSSWLVTEGGQEFVMNFTVNLMGIGYFLPGLGSEVSNPIARGYQISKMHFLNCYTRVCSGKRLICTRTNALGIAPAKSQEGDLVAFLYGAKVPFILRNGSTKGRYELVGEAYVHGLMNGEIAKLGLQARRILLE